MKILVIRLSSIGDIILTTPVLKKIKEKYPEAKIHYLVLEKFKDVICGNPYVDEVITFNKERDDGIFNIYKFSKKLDLEGYDYVLDLHSKYRSWVISSLLKGKVLRYKKRNFFKSLLVKLKIIKYKVDSPIVKSYFKPLEELKIHYVNEDLTFSYEEKDIIKVKNYKGHPILAPGASKETKKWPIEYFGEISKKIFEKYGVPPIIIGGKEDFELGEKIRKLDGGKGINLCGELTLKESGALLSQSKFILSNDSGPFHIARGVKCRSFVIFGPTSPKMFEFNSNETLVYLGVECSPCSLHGDKRCPKGNFKCMKDLNVNYVYNEIVSSII